jgi:hypothetical protein
MRAQVRAAAAQPVSPSVPVKPPEPVQHDPAWVVQRAWGVFRLPRLQELVELTIVELQALPPLDLAEHEVVGAERPECDPVAEALRSICEELRDAASIAGADVARANHCKAMREHMAQQPSAWSDTFVAALQGYRRIASRALESAFTRAVAA